MKQKYEEELELVGTGKKIENINAEELNSMASHTIKFHLENDIYRAFIEMDRAKQLLLNAGKHSGK